MMTPRRLLPLAAVLLGVAASSASGGDIYSRKHSVDSRLEHVRAKIAWAERRQDELAAEIASVNDQIHGLARQVGDVTAQLEPLERDLELHKEKLDRLTELYRVQTERYLSLRRQYEISVERLDDRLVDLYIGGEPSSLEVLFAASSFTDLITQAQYVDDISNQDKRIAQQVGIAKVEARKQRQRTKRFRAVVASETRTIAARTAQVRAVREALVSKERQLAAARSTRRESLLHVNESKHEYLAEATALAQASSALAAKIQASSGSYSPPNDTTPSAAGFIWPVSGPVVSGFGMRWGRMHEGIDIAVPDGTPIHAAASGRVIYAGWMSGYGNLTAIDHGRGLSTAYGHQSSIGVSVGQNVTQGQVIGYVGCTGHCFGPHLHFEVRINGSPVDPLGYL
jgi:murein DD-endopeptidase MepM/ murein hydrolase activator NlpD